jgi:hypothetical protein
MTAIELLAGNCAGNLEMLKWMLGDFSDADMMVRPCPGANHAAWQLGHLVSSETFMASGCGAAMPELPAGFNERFDNKRTSVDDPKAFASKAELLDLLAKTRAATVKWIGSLTEADLAKPGPEKMRQYAPTVGNVVCMIETHLVMHLGQMQVIRRKLGKPVLF